MAFPCGCDCSGELLTAHQGNESSDTVPQSLVKHSASETVKEGGWEARESFVTVPGLAGDL